MFHEALEHSLPPPKFIDEVAALLIPKERFGRLQEWLIGSRPNPHSLYPTIGAGFSLFNMLAQFFILRLNSQAHVIDVILETQ